MASVSQPGPALPAGWMETLDKVEQDLRRAAAAAEEEKLPEALATASPDDPDGPHHRLEQWAERLRQFQAAAGQAAQEAEEVDGDLQTAEAELTGWLARAAAVRQSLAEWLGRGV